MLFLILFIFIFLESLVGLGYFFPGTFLLVLLSAKRGLNYFFILFIISITANLLGSTLNYYLGYKAGKKVLTQGFLFLSSDYFKKGVEFAHRYKGRFLLIGKLVPGIKEIITFLAGVFHLPPKKFFFWNTLGALLWFMLYFLIGYIFGLSFISLVNTFNKVQKIFLFLFILFLVFILLRFFIVFFGKKMFLFLKQISDFLAKKYKLKLNFKRVFQLLFLFSIIYLFLSYIGFAKLIYSLPLVKYIDLSVENTMIYFSNFYFEKIALFVSFFGSFVCVFILSMLFLFSEKNKSLKFNFLIGLFFIIFLVLSTKFIVARHRPYFGAYEEIFYSFPSFHAALSMYFYGFMAYYLAKKSKYWNEKVNWFVLLLFIVLLIGLSRLYLNVHYFSDIIGGYFLGLIILFFVLLLPIRGKSKVKINYFLLIGLIITLIGSLLIYVNRPIRQNFSKSSYKNINLKDFLKNKKNLYITTIFNRKTEPINFIFLAKNPENLKQLFLQAGFYTTDKISPSSIKLLMQGAYLGKSYNQAPMLPLIWNYQVQNFNFQLQTGDLLFRHHIRIWNTHYKYDTYIIFVGLAVYDAGLKWKITHKISPYIDKEREYFFNKLKKTGLIAKWEKIQLVSPFSGYNFSYDKFYTDGKAYIVWVK